MKNCRMIFLILIIFFPYNLFASINYADYCEKRWEAYYRLSLDLKYRDDFKQDEWYFRQYLVNFYIEQFSNFEKDMFYKVKKEWTEDWEVYIKKGRDNNKYLIHLLNADLHYLWNYEHWIYISPMCFSSELDYYEISIPRIKIVYSEANFTFDDQPLNASLPSNVVSQIQFMSFLYHNIFFELNKKNLEKALFFQKLKNEFITEMKKWAIDNGWCDQQINALSTGYYILRVKWLKQLIEEDFRLSANEQILTKGNFPIRQYSVVQEPPKSKNSDLDNFLNSSFELVLEIADVAKKVDESYATFNESITRLYPSATSDNSNKRLPSNDNDTYDKMNNKSNIPKQKFVLLPIVPPDVIIPLKINYIFKGHYCTGVSFQVGSNEQRNNEWAKRGIVDYEIDFGDGSLPVRLTDSEILYSDETITIRSHDHHFYYTDGTYFVKARYINLLNEKSNWSNPIKLDIKILGSHFIKEYK